MSFFAILFALLIEQVRPLAPHNPIHSGLRVWARWVSSNFDAGKPQHGWVSWVLAVVAPAVLALAIHWLLLVFIGWPAAMVWSVLVLYATLGFRQFSHHFTQIRDALESGDEVRARQLLALWQRGDASELPRSEIVRHVIEYSVLAAHRHVFGVLAWFSILAAFGLGPAGAVLYRMAEFVARYWRHRNRMQLQPASEALQSAAARAWTAVDWLPARITAIAFAVVGSFEEAIDCWRNHAQRFPNDNDGVILAATSGAVNVRLGGEALRPVFSPGSSQTFQAAGLAASEPPTDTTSTPGREAEVGHLRSIVGLVWRSVVLWMVLLALLTLARLLG
ncbi:CobD/CbiB family protein [Ramlibacter sp.]|jgi:adenosylcobinamide-phosphate synthase|uniref:CobD/CbiB family protein n=1 Tax=Ramlibacter sp. TaxID=1917967 RepID=UPI00261AC4B8|nr:CobD/CbiB family protein [Ramlibacter sp.]MDB5955328.1 putative rane protein distantly related to cobalamin biosynthesis protein [Ramlibacter sp.]